MKAVADASLPVTFQVAYKDADGQTLASAPTNAGSYDVVLSYAGDATYAPFQLTISDGLVIDKTGSEVTPDVPSASIDADYGDTIELKANVVKAASRGVALLAADAADQDKVAFYCGDTLLGTVDVQYTNESRTNGSAVLSYDTSKGGIPVGAAQTIKAVYGGSVNLNGSSDDSISVTLAKKELAIEGLAATNRPYDGTVDVVLTGGELTGKVGNDQVSVTMPTAGTVENADAGDGKAVTIDEIKLVGVDAGKYTLKQPSGIKVNISQVQPSFVISADKTSLVGGGTVKLKMESVQGVPADGVIEVTQKEGADGEAKTLTADADGAYTVDLPNWSATYTFTATYDGDKNHAVASAKCEVTVSHWSSGMVSNTVTAPSAVENGTVEVGSRDAFAGDTVTIVAKPDEGYVLDKLSVTDAAGNAIELTDKGDGTFTFTMPSSKVTVEASFKPAAVDPEPEPQPENPFVDVAEDDYFADAVAWAVANGVTTGVSPTEFAPYAPCTRAQMLTFLWRASGSPSVEAEVGFADVPADAYYADAVAWAVANGVTTGVSPTEFAPDEAVTRGQAVTFMHRAAGSPAADGAGFSDIPEGAYFADAVAWAAESGVTTGVSPTEFAPDEDCLRGQAVTFLFRAQQ